jgi:hypothetical protein
MISIVALVVICKNTDCSPGDYFRSEFKIADIMLIINIL